jgi:glycine betaine/choline ABC-type transport system substrate-binding protein
MALPSRKKASTLIALLLGGLTPMAAVAGCGGSGRASGATSTATSTTSTSSLPGTGRPPVTIGDKNFTEQFVLGELYSLALQAQGYTVMLSRNYGSTEVTLGALDSGRLGMYPEYLGTWDSDVAGYKRSFRSPRAAYRAGQQYAAAHGLQLLRPTPFSSTGAIAVMRAYAAEHGMHGLEDLRDVAAVLTLGAPQEIQQSPTGLPLLEQVYGFVPASFKALDVGAQYQALDQGVVQAAYAGTTDGELTSGRYSLLRDTRHAFGWGNVVPVVSARVLAAEGPAFKATIDRVSALLTTRVMRQLNAAVDIGHQDPAVVAKQFLQAHGLVPADSTS